MEARASCFEHLQVICDPIPRAGALNMAIDEVLLAKAGDVALLRLYAWIEPTVTFGFFESARSAGQIAQGRTTVRRWTGGGIVEHGEDLTYSLCVPRVCAFARLRPSESYRRIHACVASALDRCGLHAESHDDPTTDRQAATHLNACFERPVLHDLLASGRKVAGGAQRRTRAGLLHQGSVQTGLPGVGWWDCLWRELPACLSASYEERSLTPEEISRAESLAKAKYETDSWNNRS